jgi:hypothetical protein
MSRAENIMYAIAAIIVLTVVFVTGLERAGPTVVKSTLFEIGVARLVDWMAEGCGPGWHWSNRRGWNWGRCVRDWHP